MLIHEIQTNLSHKHVTNENVLGSFSKCGGYILNCLDFEVSGLFYQILKVLWRTKSFQIMISYFSIKVTYNNKVFVFG